MRYSRRAVVRNSAVFGMTLVAGCNIGQETANVDVTVSNQTSRFQSVTMTITPSGDDETVLWRQQVTIPPSADDDPSSESSKIITENALQDVEEGTSLQVSVTIDGVDNPFTRTVTVDCVEGDRYQAGVYIRIGGVEIRMKDEAVEFRSVLCSKTTASTGLATG